MRVDSLGHQAFAVIADLGSFQRAADPLHLSRTIGLMSRRGVPLTADASGILARIESELVHNFTSHVALSASPLSRPRD